MQSADGRYQHNGAILLGLHIGIDHAAQPIARQNVVVHDFVKNLIAHATHRPIVWVAGSIADQDVNGSPGVTGLLNHCLQLILQGDAGADGHGGATFGLNFFHNSFAGIQLSTRDDHFGPRPGQLKCDRSADASACPRDDGYFVGQVK